MPYFLIWQRKSLKICTKRTSIMFKCYTGLSSLGDPGVPWHTQIFADQLSLFQPGKEIMPTWLILAHPDFQTFRRPCEMKLGSSYHKNEMLKSWWKWQPSISLLCPLEHRNFFHKQATRVHSPKHFWPECIIYIEYSTHDWPFHRWIVRGFVSSAVYDVCSCI